VSKEVGLRTRRGKKGPGREGEGGRGALGGKYEAEGWDGRGPEVGETWREVKVFDSVPGGNSVS
jgi:hypothetical protein